MIARPIVLVHLTHNMVHQTRLHRFIVYFGIQIIIAWIMFLVWVDGSGIGRVWFFVRLLISWLIVFEWTDLLDNRIITTMDRKAIRTAGTQGQFPRYQMPVLVSRYWLFPWSLLVLLAWYLIETTQLFAWHLSRRYLVLDHSLLLVIVIGSGLLSLCLPGGEQTYLRKRISRGLAIVYYIVLVVVSLWSSWILFDQLSELPPWMRELIAWVTGVLTFVIGRMVGWGEDLLKTPD